MPEWSSHAAGGRGRGRGPGEPVAGTRCLCVFGMGAWACRVFVERRPVGCCWPLTPEVDVLLSASESGPLNLVPDHHHALPHPQAQNRKSASPAPNPKREPPSRLRYVRSPPPPSIGDSDLTMAKYPVDAARPPPVKFQEIVRDGQATIVSSTITFYRGIYSSSPGWPRQNRDGTRFVYPLPAFC